MKNKYLITALLVVAVMLSSCSGIMRNSTDNNNNINGSVTTEGARATESTLSITQDDMKLSLDACKAVLDNNSMMYDTETNEKMYISDYIKNRGLSISKYSIVDLNGDSNPELVVWLALGTNDYFGFLILHNDHDTVYAHELTYRAFYELKEDGTFTCSGGVADHGISKIDFINDTYTINKIAYCESEYGAQKVSYYIENRGVSKEDFETYITEQSNKQNVAWHEFTIDDFKNDVTSTLPT